MIDTHEDRCIDCLLGTACGDTLGAAVEGWSAPRFVSRFRPVHRRRRGDGTKRDESDTVRHCPGRLRVRASEAVAAAYGQSSATAWPPEESIIRAVNFGGDTDTIGTTAGAATGTLHARV